VKRLIAAAAIVAVGVGAWRWRREQTRPAGTSAATPERTAWPTATPAPGAAEAPSGWLRLEDALAARGVGQTHLGFAFGGRPVTIANVVPGAYTVCGVAFPTGVQSVRDAAPLRDQLDRLPVLCAPVTITDARAQNLAVPVPAPPTM
jgi:hypothetical protein